MSIPINAMERKNLIQEISLFLFAKHEHNPQKLKKHLDTYKLNPSLSQLKKRNRFISFLEQQSDETLFNIQRKEAINSSIITNPTYIKAMATDPRFQKIFISHSSHDKAYAQAMVNLLIDLGVQPEHIYCNSYPGHGTTFGQNYIEDLKLKLQDNVLVLFLFSENFFKSNFCLCEMGATWVLSQAQIPIYIPPFAPEDVKGVFHTSQGFPINHKHHLSAFKEEIEKRHQLTPIKSVRWSTTQDRFIKEIDLLQQ
ncbi:TIR domain-containing protein [Aquimarina rhabdastrellae]